MRLCAWCSAPIPDGSHPAKRYCSAKCRARRCDAAAQQDGRADQWREAKNDRNRRKPEQSLCHHCGASFYQVHKRRYCSPTCSHRAFHERRKGSDAYKRAVSDRSRRRRARHKQAVIEVFTATEIFERDGWRCHICRRPVRRSVDPNHDRAPTLDHLIPLARGGEHSRRNVATAHRICNSRKSCHRAGDQLALIG